MSDSQPNLLDVLMTTQPDALSVSFDLPANTDPLRIGTVDYPAAVNIANELAAVFGASVQIEDNKCTITRQTDSTLRFSVTRQITQYGTWNCLQLNIDLTQQQTVGGESIDIFAPELTFTMFETQHTLRFDCVPLIQIIVEVNTDGTHKLIIHPGFGGGNPDEPNNKSEALLIDLFTYPSRALARTIENLQAKSIEHKCNYGEHTISLEFLKQLTKDSIYNESEIEALLSEN